MRRRPGPTGSGLTLVEVCVALAIAALTLTGFVAAQAAASRTHASALRLEALHRLAADALVAPPLPGGPRDCPGMAAAPPDPELRCTVEVTACRVVAGVLACGGGPLGRVAVRAAHGDGARVELDGWSPTARGTP